MALAARAELPVTGDVALLAVELKICMAIPATVLSPRLPCLVFLPFTKAYTGALAVRVNEDHARPL